MTLRDSTQGGDIDHPPTSTRLDYSQEGGGSPRLLDLERAPGVWTKVASPRTFPKRGSGHARQRHWIICERCSRKLPICYLSPSLSAMPVYRYPVSQTRASRSPRCSSIHS